MAPGKSVGGTAAAVLMLSIAMCICGDMASGAAVSSGENMMEEQLLQQTSDWIISLQPGLAHNNITAPGSNDTLHTSIFINGNLARVLLAAHRLLPQAPNREAYEKVALSWCDALVDRQIVSQSGSTPHRPIGYFTTGYPTSGPLGDVYLADTGSAVTTLAQCVSRLAVTDPRRERWIQSMQLFMAFVQDGIAQAPVGRGHKGASTWMITEGADAGALGCGYYHGHRSQQAYTISTETVGCFATLGGLLLGNATWTEMGIAAQQWLAKQVQPSGIIKYRIDGTTIPNVQHQYQAASYGAELLVANALYPHPRSPAPLAAFNSTVEWLVSSLEDGSWGKPGSGEALRSPRAYTLLQAYMHAYPEAAGKIKPVLQKWMHNLHVNHKVLGLNTEFIYTGFVGLVLADAIKFGTTFDM